MERSSLGLSKRTWRGGEHYVLLVVFVLLLLSASLAPVHGAGTVQFGNARAIDPTGYAPFHVLAADLDNDGDQDVLITSYDGGWVRFYKNEDGEGRFSEPAFVSEDSTCGAIGIAVGDLDGDSFGDVVVACQLGDKVTWFRNLNGAAFSTGVDIDTNVDAATDIELADIDEDGHLDVVAVFRNDDGVSWYRNADGEGTFEAGLTISTSANGAYALTVTDLDDDGDLDVVSASAYGALEWFKNSNGAFSLGVALEPQTSPAGFMDVVAADFDGDGNVDVVTAAYDDNHGIDGQFYPGRLIMFMNDGAGSFEVGRDIDLLDSARSVVAVDLDGDEDFDLVVSDSWGGRVVWYENDGQGGLSAAIDIAKDVGVWRVIAADLDGDGDLDIVSANRQNDRVVWYENFLIEATPAPFLITSTSTNAPEVVAPVNATEPPASSIDGTTSTPGPVGVDPVESEPTAATPEPSVDPVESEPTADASNDSGTSSGDGSNMTEEIIIAVVSTVASAVVLGVLKMFFSRRSSRHES